MRPLGRGISHIGQKRTQTDKLGRCVGVALTGSCVLSWSLGCTPPLGGAFPYGFYQHGIAVFMGKSSATTMPFITLREVVAWEPQSARLTWLMALGDCQEANEFCHLLLVLVVP